MARQKADSVHYKTYSMRLPEAAIEALQNLALVMGVPASELGRRAVEEFLAEKAGAVLQELAADRERKERAAREVLAYVEVKAS